MEPHPRFNIIEGANGQGKTNLLEGIYILGALKSFRETKNKPLIAWEEKTALVRGTLVRRDIERSMSVELTRVGRRGCVDGKIVKRLSDYFGLLHLVVFNPDDLNLTKGGPGVRRRFLDRAIFNTNPGYINEVRDYLSAMKNRNELLRGSMMSTIDEALSRVLMRNS